VDLDVVVVVDVNVDGFLAARKILLEKQEVANLLREEHEGA
jgi:hypothetical protein